MELFPLWMTTFPLSSNKQEQGCSDGGENAADWTHSSYFYYLMGGAISRISERRGAAAQHRLSLGILKNMRVSVSQRLGLSALFSQPVQADCRTPVPELLLPPEDRGQTSEMTLTSVFLPEFPQHVFPEQDHFEILGLVAKGSYGPILRVKDMFKDKVFAVKVLPKSKIIEDGLVEQVKEEVIIQRQLKHPFIHILQACWQTRHHLFIMCSYCSFGDLHTYWLLKGQFGEKEIRLFAAELGCALGFLHDLGIIHRDVKMENILLSDRGHLRLSDFGLSRRLKRGGRAFTVCGTIQYMAPEVLSGGPYSHAADWWSLGIMLFSLVTGEFPVPAELDHITMLNKVAHCAYVLPKSYSSALILLLTELLCKDPARRLRNLECFEMQPFFHGSSFDPLLLQKTPVDVILKLRNHPDWTAKATRGCSLDDFDNFLCSEIICSSASNEPSPTSSNMDLGP